MTQEDKELLLKDLCARLPYEVVIELDEKFGFNKGTHVLVKELLDSYCVEGIKPYLRPLSSITEEEKEEIKPFFSEFKDEFGKRELVVRQNKMFLYQDWLNAHHFDYRGLIPKGLAIEVTEENNPYK